MSIHFPPECAWLFAILTGEVPPDGDEDKMFALAEVHKDLHGKLNKDFQAMVAEVLGYTKQNFDGDAAKMYQEAMKSFLGGQEGLDYFNAVGDQAQLVADFTRKSATQLQYTKYMIIAQLVALLIEAAVAAATAFFFGASIAVYLKKQAIVRVILKTKLGRMIVTLLTHQIINVGMGVTMDAMIQWIQLNQGTRDEWDTDLTKNAALSGMVQGLLAGPFNALGDRFGKLLAKMFGLDAGRNLGNKIDGVLPPPKPKDLDVKPLPKKPDAKPGADAPVPPPKDAPVPPPKDAPEPKPKTESGTPEPTPKPKPETEAPEPKPKPETGEPAPKPGSNKPDTDKPGPQPPVSFGRDMSEAFRKNLPNTYGPGSAKAGRQFVDDVGEAFRRRFGDGAVDAGRDWARTLLEKTGTRELPDALEKSLGPIAKDLGPDLTKVLSQGAADSLGRSILREFVEGTGRGVFEGAHAAVSEGMYNLIFSDEHTFKTSGLTFGSGMVEGRLGAMMEAGGENLAMGLRGNLGMAPPSWLTDGGGAGAGSGGTASLSASGSGGLTDDMPDLQLDEFFDDAGSLTSDMRNLGLDDFFDDAGSLTSDMRDLGLDEFFDGGNEDGRGESDGQGREPSPNGPVMTPPVTAPVPTATGGGAGAGGGASTTAPQPPAAQQGTPLNQGHQGHQGNPSNQAPPRTSANDNGSGAEKPAALPMESGSTLTPDSTDEQGGSKGESAPEPPSVIAPATMSNETAVTETAANEDMLPGDDELDFLDVSQAPPMVDDTLQNAPENPEHNTGPMTPPFAMTTDDTVSDDGDSVYETASEFSVYTDAHSDLEQEQEQEQEQDQLGSDDEETAGSPVLAPMPLPPGTVNLAQANPTPAPQVNTDQNPRSEESDEDSETEGGPVQESENPVRETEETAVPPHSPVLTEGSLPPGSTVPRPDEPNSDADDSEPDAEGSVSENDDTESDGAPVSLVSVEGDEGSESGDDAASDSSGHPYPGQSEDSHADDEASDSEDATASDRSDRSDGSDSSGLSYLSVSDDESVFGGNDFDLDRLFQADNDGGEDLAPAVRDLGTDQRGIPGGVQLTTVGPGVVNTLRRQVLDTLADRGIGESDPHRADVERQLDTLLSPQALHDNRVMLLSPDGHRITVVHNGTEHPLDVRMHLSGPRASEMYGSSGRVPPRNNEDRLSSGYDRTSQGGTSAVRTLSVPTWAGTLVNKLNTLAVPVLGDVWNRITGFTLSATPTATLGRHTLSTTVAQAVTATTMMRSGERAVPFDYQAAWSIRTSNDDTPAPGDGTGDGIPLRQLNANLWSTPADSGIVTAWFPKHLTVSGPEKPSGEPHFISRNENEFRAHLDRMPLWTMDSMTDPGSLLRHAEGEFGRQFDQLSAGSRDAFRRFFGGPQQLGALPLQYAGSDAERSSKGTISPLLVDRDGNAVGMFKVTASITPVRGLGLRDIHVTDTYNFERAIDRVTKVDSQAKVSHTLGAEGAFGATLNTQRPGDPSAFKDFNIGITGAVKGSGSLQKDQSFGAGSTHNMLRNLRANGGHVLTPARVGYQVTFIAADGTAHRAGREMAATDVWIRALHPDTVKDTTPEQTLAPPPEVANLQSLGVSATPLAVDGAGARAVLAETRRWLADNGYLPRTEPVNWPGGEALVKARLENLRDLDLFTSSHGLQAGADEMVDGGYTLHFNKPGLGGTNERIAVTLDLRTPETPANANANGNEAPQTVQHLKKASGVVIPNISGITIPGNSSRTRTTSWSLGGSVDAGRAVGDSAVRLSGNAEIKKTWQDAHTLTTGSGLAYSQLLGTSKQSTEIFRVPAELHLTISAGRDPVHGYHSGMFTPADQGGPGAPNEPRAYLDIALPEKRTVSGTAPTTGDITVTDQGGLLPDNAMVDIMRGSAELNTLVNDLLRRPDPDPAPANQDTAPGNLPDGNVLPTRHPQPTTPGGSSSLLSSFLDTATTVRRVVTGDDRAAEQILLSEAIHAQLTPGALTARAHQLLKGAYVIDDLFVPGATAGTDLVVEIKARATNVRQLATVTQYGEVDLGFIDSASHQTSTTTSLEGGGGLGLKSGPDRRAAEAAAAGTPADGRPVTGGGGAKVIHGRGSTHAVTAAASTSNTHVPSESGAYHRMAADIEYEVTVVRGHRGGPVHATPVTLRDTVTVPGGMQFLATPEQLRHSGQLTDLAGIARQDNRPQDIPLPDRFRTHGIAGLATVLEVTPLTTPLPAPRPPAADAPATDPDTAVTEPAVTEPVPNQPGPNEDPPGPDPRDFFRTRLTELISTEAPGALTPGGSHYVPGLRQRIADFTSPAAMAALVGRGGDQPLVFTFPYPDGLTTKDVTVRLSGRSGWDRTALDNARGRAAGAGAGLETFSQHAPNNITDARSTTTKWNTSGSGSAAVPTAATGSHKLGANPGTSHSTTRTDTVTTTTTGEDRIWQRTDGGAEFKLAWTFNAEISVNGVHRGAIPEVDASVTLRFAHDNAPAAGGPVVDRLPAGVHEQDPRTGLTPAQSTPVRPSGTEVVYGTPQSEQLLNAIHVVAPTLVDANGLISGVSQEAAAVRITELLHGGQITVDPLRQAAGLGGPPVHTADGNPRVTLSTEVLRPQLLGDSRGVTIDRVRQTGFGITTGSSTSRTTNLTLGVNHTVDAGGNHTLGANTTPFHYQSVPQGQGGGDTVGGRRWTKVGSAGQRTATAGLRTHEIEADTVTTVTGPDGTRHVTGTAVLRVSELDLLGLGVLPDADRGEGIWDLSAPSRRPDNAPDPGPSNPDTRPDATITEQLNRAREQQENTPNAERSMPQLWMTLPRGDRNDPEWRAAEQQAMERTARIARDSDTTVELAVRDDDGIRYRVFTPAAADGDGGRDVPGPGGPRPDSLAAQPLTRPTPSVATVSSSPPPPPPSNRPEGNTEPSTAPSPPRNQDDTDRPAKPPRAEGDFVKNRVTRQELPVRRRDDTAAVSTERFDPKLRQDNRPAGRLNGSETLIRYRVSREQLPDGRTARHFFVTLPFKLGRDVDATDLRDVQSRVQNALDTHINRGYRLPGSGDQLMVTAGFIAAPDRGDAITLTKTPAPGRADQLHWDVNDNDPTLTHEVLHYLGLPDEYLDTPGRKDGDPHLFRARENQSGVHSDGPMVTTEPESLSTVLADHLATIERVSDTANIPLHSASGPLARTTSEDLGSKLPKDSDAPAHPTSQGPKQEQKPKQKQKQQQQNQTPKQPKAPKPPTPVLPSAVVDRNEPFKKAFPTADTSTLSPADYHAAVRDSVNEARPLSFVVNAMIGYDELARNPQAVDDFIASVLDGLPEKPESGKPTGPPRPEVAFVIGVNGTDNENPADPISDRINAAITAAQRDWKVPVALVAVPIHKDNKSFPYGTGRNGVLTSDATREAINGLRADKTHPYVAFMDLDPYPRTTPSGRHAFVHFEHRLGMGAHTGKEADGLLPPLRPLLFSGGYNIPAATDAEGRGRFIEETRHRWMAEATAKANKSGNPVESPPADLEHLIPVFDTLVRHDMRIRDRMSDMAPMLPYSPEPNLFVDGLATLLTPGETGAGQGLKEIRFDPGSGEIHGLANNLMQVAAWEINAEVPKPDAPPETETGPEADKKRADAEKEYQERLRAAAENLRPPTRGTAFFVDFQEGAVQTDLSRLFQSMLKSRTGNFATWTLDDIKNYPGALKIQQSHLNPIQYSRLFDDIGALQNQLAARPLVNNDVLTLSDPGKGDFLPPNRGKNPVTADTPADPLAVFANKPLRFVAVSAPLPGQDGMATGLNSMDWRLHALNVTNLSDEAVLQRGFHEFAELLETKTEAKVSEQANPNPETAAEYPRVHTLDFDNGSALITRPGSFFHALGQALNPGSDSVPATVPFRSEDGTRVAEPAAPRYIVTDGVEGMLKQVMATHTDAAPEPLNPPSGKPPTDLETAEWVRTATERARALVARAQETNMTVEDLLTRLFTGRLHPMSHDFDTYTAPSTPPGSPGPFALDASALLLLDLYAEALGRTLVVTGPDGTQVTRPENGTGPELRMEWGPQGWVAAGTGPNPGGEPPNRAQQAFDLLNPKPKGTGTNEGAAS
ncbi:hypothetical protein [Streptomyces qinzhouensis]|uniref:Outer membrane channel protein CpnT-like N-terminal domain-containing protein n=1 Tax=Streptomyces qinzhouensis TaxID=2599401 RepID=A0A5B8INJ1_9ACTN|nr:hypothetical protein [Streptomyces qinzhouensis]QDY80222.1 hypothetical protein FQU76_31100 [Streptomyces qinzhouensis]